MDLNAHLHTPLQASLRSTLIELFWYALMASAVWLLFYVAFRAAFRHRRVSRGDPTARQIGREIAHLLRSNSDCAARRRVVTRPVTAYEGVH